MAAGTPRNNEETQLFSWVCKCRICKHFVELWYLLMRSLIVGRFVSFFSSQGANSHGQLCLGHTDDVLIPESFDDSPENTCKLKEVALIQGGGGHTAVITGFYIKFINIPFQRHRFCVGYLTWACTSKVVLNCFHEINLFEGTAVLNAGLRLFPELAHLVLPLIFPCPFFNFSWVFNTVVSREINDKCSYKIFLWEKMYASGKSGK